MIFDTHAHYDDDAFDEDREALLASLPQNGVEAVTNVGASLKGCRKSVEMARRYPHVYAAVGVHPDHVNELSEERLEWLEQTAREEKKVVAIGEIGLDYYWDISAHEVQKEWFRRQLKLAEKVGLPVIIHSREAAQDTFDLLKEEKAGDIGGVIHCYSGSVEMAREYVKMGFFIGIGGVLTFKNAKVIKAVAADIPLERIVLETDCPYLAPVPYRGKRNCSLYLPHVVETLSEIRGVSPEEVIRITCENAKRLYRLSE
ncbi:MAG: TatD family hydrolase [Lachnospiraceae bacterium]|nr:TatD family hydrolase [Lachnospiraceae bacterium]